uniref:Uncharacterized protein n=1 Tax=Brassica campestris TaxID=3711 RepID=M4CRB9_BRACM
MWRPWRKSSVKIHNTFSPTASFKDIHHLCTTDDSSSFPSSPCASPSPSPNNVSRVFHRVCAANLILRSWPTRPSNNLLRADSEPIRRNHEPDPKQSKPEPDAIRISILGAESSIVVYFTSLRVLEDFTMDINKMTQQNAIPSSDHVSTSLPPRKPPSPPQQSHPPPPPPFMSRSGGSNYSDCLLLSPPFSMACPTLLQSTFT